jgi:hypothetical protein
MSPGLHLQVQCDSLDHQQSNESTTLGTLAYMDVDINLLKPTDYVMHQQVESFNNCKLCPHCIYVFCICLRTKSDLCHLHNKNRLGFITQMKCSQRGTDWVFK